jgi:hypothetical protein
MTVTYRLIYPAGTVRSSSKPIPSVSVISCLCSILDGTIPVLRLHVFVDSEGNKRDNLTIICEFFKVGSIGATIMVHMITL